MHCLGRYAELTDYSCYGFGKWCDGCEPILTALVKKSLRASRRSTRRPGP
jgi:hypothetical protein